MSDLEDKRIEALQAKLQGKVDTGLQKAKGEDDEKEKDDYDAEYMKKHMAKYMKENPSSMKKAENTNVSEMQTMQKAVSNEFGESENNLEGADATIVDGTEMFKAFANFTETMTKAVNAISSRLDNIEGITVSLDELGRAQGEVLVKAATILDSMGKTPESVKGKVTAAITGEEAKKGPLQKAADMGIAGMKTVLMKAIQSGNMNAGNILTQVECSGNDISRIPF
jgi:hypothetical protein